MAPATTALRLRRLRVGGPRTIARTEGAAGRAALAFYRPQSVKGRMLLRLSEWLTHTPLGEEISLDGTLQHRLRILMDDAACDSPGGPPNLARLGAAVLGSSRPGRWIAGIARGATLHIVAKIATGPDPGLRNEIQALGRELSSHSWRMPALHPELVQPDVLAMAWHPGVPQMNPAPVFAICQDLQRRGIVHGDLGAWNILHTGPGRHILLDWETAIFDTLRPGHDLIHYHAKRSLLLDGKPPQTLVEELLLSTGWLARLLDSSPQSTPGSAPGPTTGFAPESAAAAILSYLAADHSGDQSESARAYRRSMLDAVRART